MAESSLLNAAKQPTLTKHSVYDNSWNFSLSKWQIALIIGTPVALGASYWWYKKYWSNKKDQENDKVVNCKRNIGVVKPIGVDDIMDPVEEARIHKNNGNKLFKEGKYDKAIECYTDAIRVCPPENKSDISTFFQNRAAAYDGLKNYREVVKDCTRALEQNSTYVKALNRRAKAYEALDEFEQALVDVSCAAVLEAFQNQNTLLVTDRILRKQSKLKAKETMKNRPPIFPSKHSILHYFNSFCEDPTLLGVRNLPEGVTSETAKDDYQRALCFVRENKFEDALAMCISEIERNSPFVQEALLLKSTLLLLRGQNDIALIELQDLNKMDSINIKIKVNALIKIGTILIQMENADGAFQCFEDAVSIDPNNPDIYLHRGQVNLLMDNVDATLRDMEKAATLNPEFPPALAQKCFVQYRCSMKYNDVKLCEGALNGFEEAMKRFPNCAESHSLYAQVLAEKADFEKANELFTKACKLDPFDATCYVHRGILVLQWKSDLIEAVNFIKMAIETDDRCQFAYETWGSLEIQKGNLREGMALFSKAIDQAHTELELLQLYCLHGAAEAQAKAVEILGVPLPSGV